MTHTQHTQSSEFAEVEKVDLVNSTSTRSKAPKILLVKLSSLGDVLHNLPIVWDLRKRLPNAQIDWIVEEAYVPLLAPLQTTENFRGIDRIIPIALRRWRKSLLRLSTWREFFAMRHAVFLGKLCLLQERAELKSRDNIFTVSEPFAGVEVPNG